MCTGAVIIGDDDGGLIAVVVVGVRCGGDGVEEGVHRNAAAVSAERGHMKKTAAVVVGVDDLLDDS